MIGKVLCFLVVSFVCLKDAKADGNNGRCQMWNENGDLISQDDWIFGHEVATLMADDASPGTVVYTFDVADVNTVTPGIPTQPSDVPYVTFVLNAAKDKLTVEVTNNILTYENNESDDRTLNTPVDFTCVNGPSQIVFRVTAAFTNNHDPVFEAGIEDTMELSMPYPNGLFVRTITVTDIDMSEKDVVLSLDSVGDDMFTVIPQEPVKEDCTSRLTIGKIYRFDLKTKRQLQLDELTMTVATVTTTQNGVSLSAVATLSFEPDVLLTTPPTPRFSEAFYKGNIDVDTPAGTEITISPAVTFDEGYHDTDLSVDVVGGHNVDPAMFSVSLVGNSVKLTLNTALPAETEDLSHMVLTLEATRQNAYATGKTTILLELPPKVCATTPVPTTETTILVTECPEVTCPEVTTTECPEVTTTECPEVTTTECPEVTTTECPEVTTTECPEVTCPEVTTTECPEVTTTECPAVTCPEVTTTECPETTCDPCVTSPDPTTTDCPTMEPTECPVCPTTEEPTVCPTTVEPTECPTVCPTTDAPVTCPTTEAPTECPTTCEPCVTSPGTGSTECPEVTTNCPLTCPTTEAPTECPVTCPTTEMPTECPVTCPTTEMPTECPTTCEPCVTSPGTGSTDCPPVTTDCPITCPTTQSPTECPITCPTTEPSTECPITCEPCSTSPGPGSGTIVFDPASYLVRIDPFHVGMVTKVTVVTNPVEPVGFELDAQNIPSDKLWIDQEGVIYTSDLAPGRYSFHVVATVEGTTLSERAPVNIQVRSVLTCGNETYFSHALVVTSVMENVAQVVVPGVDTDVGCTGGVYQLVEGDAFFTVDSATGELASIAGKIDREDRIYIGEEKPIVRATLRVTCPDEKNSRTNTRAIDSTWSVESNRNEMVVAAVIEDENDNAPVFDDVSPLVIGYPDSSLTSQLNPSALVTVKATDADIGDNAAIQYSVSATDTNFHIHNTTGTLYIVDAAALSGDQTVTVTAADQAGGGLRTSLRIDVKMLSRSRVTQMVVKGRLLEDVAAILSNLSTATSLSVRALDAAVLPRLADQRSQDGRLDNAALRLVVYALDGENNVVLSEEFVTKVQDNNGTLNFVVQDIRELETVGVTPPTDTTGLMAAIISLSVICGLLLVAGGVAFYFFYVRPRMQTEAQLKGLMSSGYDTSSNVSGEDMKETQDDEEKANISSWMRQTGEENPAMDNDATDTFNMSRSPSTPDLQEVTVDRGVLSEFVMPTGAVHENTSDVVALPKTTGVDIPDEDEFDEDEERRRARLAERKRSMVTFNESVDCIEIESERV